MKPSKDYLFGSIFRRIFVKFAFGQILGKIRRNFQNFKKSIFLIRIYQNAK